MNVWLLRADMADIRRAWPTRLTALGARPGKGLPPLILVPGASPNQELKCCAEGKEEKFGPISEAIARAVVTPMVGIAVIEQGLADDARQRIGGAMSGLALGNQQTVSFPIDVVERQGGDLPGAQSVGHEQEQDRVVALADRTATVDPLKHPPDLVPADRPQHGGQSVRAWRLDRAGQVTCDDTFPAGVSHEDPERTAQPGHGGTAQSAACLGHKGAEDGR